MNKHQKLSTEMNLALQALARRLEMRDRPLTPEPQQQAEEILANTELPNRNDFQDCVNSQGINAATIAFIGPDDERFPLQRKNDDLKSLAVPTSLENIPSGHVGYLLGHTVENLVRKWLAAQMPISDAKILIYEKLAGKNCAENFALEIDALATSNGVPDIIFEIKCTPYRHIHRHGLRQLDARLEIARIAYPDIGAALIKVRPNSPAEAGENYVRLQNNALPIEEVRRIIRDGNIPNINLSFDDVVKFGKSIDEPIRDDLVQIYKSFLGGVRHRIQPEVRHRQEKWQRRFLNYLLRSGRLTQTECESISKLSADERISLLAKVESEENSRNQN